jgi:hypothetical protein
MNFTTRIPNRYGDQRRLLRRPVRLAARYVSSNLNLEGHVTDLGPEGLFFSSDYLDGPGEPASVWVDLPSGPGRIELRGEVRWVNDAAHAGGMGIRLFEISVEARILLSSLVASSAFDTESSPANA